MPESGKQDPSEPAAAPQTEQIKKRRLHKTRKAMSFSVKFFFELFVVVLLLTLIAGGAFVYKVAKNDLDVDFAKRHLEKTINAQIAPYRVETALLGIEWKNIFERPVFYIDDIRFLNADGENILTMEALEFTLSRTRLLTGMFRPKSIDVRGLDLHFVRRRDGAIHLGFVAGPSYIIYHQGEEQGGASYGTLNEIYQAHLAPVIEDGFLANLKELSVSDSAIVFEDLAKDYALSFPDVDTTLTPQGKRLNLDLGLNIQSGRTRDFIQAGLSYDSRYQELKTDLTTQNFNPFLWASLFDVDGINAENSSVKINSDLSVTLDNNFNMQGAELVFSALEGKLALPDLYDHPFLFDRLSLNGFFNRQALTFDLKDSLLEAYNIPIQIEGQIPVFSESIREYTLPIQLKIPEFTVPIAERSFPDKFEDKPIYKWLTQRLTGGTIRDFDMQLGLSLVRLEEGGWDGDLSKLLSSFSFEDLDVDYKAPMMPLTGARGTAKIDSGPDVMTLTSETGAFGDIKLSEITVGIRDLLAKKKSTVDLDFKAEGPFKGVLAYLSTEPVSVKEKIEFDPAAVEGQAKLHAKMTIPTKKDVPLEEIKMDITGTLSDALIPGLVRGLDVSGQSIAFTLKDGLMRAEGNGYLSSREGHFLWQQYLKSAGKPFKMKVDAALVSDVNLRRHFGVGIDDFISGAAGLDLVYTSYPDKTADIDVKADLTPAQIHYKALGYHKAAGQKAESTLKAKLQNDQIQSVTDLDITAPDLSVRGAQLRFQNGDLKSASFKNNQVGATKADLELTYTAPRAISLDIKGAALDARALLGDKDKSPYDGPALRITADVKKLLTHEDQSLSQAKIFVNMLKNGDISQFEMDSVAGEGEVYIRYKPDASGSPNLNAQMEDAGAALRAFGLYENVRGGRITVTGTSSDANWRGNVSGNFLLQNFSVRKAPVLAKLINAMSLPGLGQLLGNDGVVFKKLTANFKWNARPEGALINVSDGRTSGSELGLTFDGVIDRATGTLNLEGTIVPVSSINKLIGDIPILGPVITGGTGTLIAATYKIKGPFADSEVRINPLSALAPGIVRKILFED